MALGSADERHLRRAIELAGLAREKGNHPFGSLLVDALGRIVLEAENTVVTSRDVTGHAELNVVRTAVQQLDADLLSGATLFASTESCAMCSGAIYWSGISRVVFALAAETLREMITDPTGASTLALSSREVLARGGRSVAVSGPHLVAEAAAVHEGFWA